MRVRANNASGGGGGGTPTYTEVQRGINGPGSATTSITIDLSKEYILYWNLKSTDTSDIYNGAWQISKGSLSLIIGGSQAHMSLNGTTLTIGQGGSATRSEYILLEVTT